jgi:DNA-binding beta-propeller fold protein YncE
MRPRSLTAFAVGVLVLLMVVPVQADHDEVERFATLPEPGPGFPEGIEADAHGNIYVATFDFTTPNVIHIFGKNGHLKDTIPLPGGVIPLGLAFDADGNLYVAGFSNGDMLKVMPPFDSSSTPADTFHVCGGMAAGCGLNAIAFDTIGDLYVSDSFGGNIFKVELPGGMVSTFFFNDLLKPGSHGFPGFGANGLAFNASGTELYIANTADYRILKLTLEGMTLTTFAESINGADGIAFDERGRLWVAANQADEVVALNASGRIVDRRGSFEGIGKHGAPRGLLFPASIVLSRRNIFVTNLALPLTTAIGDEPEEDVTTFTVSRIPIGKAGR